MARRPVRTVVVLVVVAAVIGGGAWAIRRGTAEQPPSFRTARLDRGPVEQAVTATGSLSAVVTVQVGSQVSGTIAKLGADFNSRVTVGQIVAQIDPTRFKATLDQADAALKAAAAARLHAEVAVRQAKLDIDRTQTLVTKQVLGVAELDAAKTKLDQAVADQAAAVAQVAQARAAVGAARVDLERTTIRAPISGTVLQRAVDVGQTVAASLQAPVLFTIAQDLSRMEVHAAIDEADVGKLKEGQDATFTVDAYPGDTFHATIFQIRSQPTVLQNVVTYDAVVRCDNPDGKLRPGMTATVRVVSSRKEAALRAPNAALRLKPSPDLLAAVDGPNGGAGGAAAGGQRDGGGGGSGRAALAAGGPGPGRGAGAGQGRGDGRGDGGGRAGGSGRGRGRVFEVKDNRLTPVYFKAGISDDDFTEIVSGNLHEGDEIVVDIGGGGAARPGTAQTAGGRRPPRLF